MARHETCCPARPGLCLVRVRRVRRRQPRDLRPPAPSRRRVRVSVPGAHLRARRDPHRDAAPDPRLLAAVPDQRRGPPLRQVHARLAAAAGARRPAGPAVDRQRVAGDAGRRAGLPAGARDLRSRHRGGRCPAGGDQPGGAAAQRHADGPHRGAAVHHAVCLCPVARGARAAGHPVGRRGRAGARPGRDHAAADRRRSRRAVGRLFRWTCVMAWAPGCAPRWPAAPAGGGRRGGAAGDAGLAVVQLPGQRAAGRVVPGVPGPLRPRRRRHQPLPARLDL